MKNILSDFEIQNIVKESALNHIAIIMDGNRRWANLKNLPSSFGHKKGAEVLKETIKECDAFGIKYLTVYAFSTENWNRTQEEVNFLMDLLVQTLKNELGEMNEKNVKIRFVGNISALPEKLKKVMNEAENLTSKNTGVNLQIAFNYGSRDEIVHAVKSIAEKINSGEINPDEITEKTISDNLYTKSIPDPDLLIRTGGEMRVSNYLLWQIAYSEFYVTDILWPDFDKESLSRAIEDFHSRQRRFGK